MSRSIDSKMMRRTPFYVLNYEFLVRGLVYMSQYVTFVPYVGITRSPLPQNNGNLPLPFFGGN